MVGKTSNFELETLMKEKKMLECVIEDRTGNLVYLTIGKNYPMVEETEIAYGVLNDLGIKVQYEKKYFKVVEGEGRGIEDDWALYEFPLDKNEDNVERELNTIAHKYFNMQNKKCVVIGIGKRVISVELCLDGRFGLKEEGTGSYTRYFHKLRELKGYVTGVISGELNRIKAEKQREANKAPGSTYPEGQSYPFLCPACDGTGAQKVTDPNFAPRDSGCKACGGTGVVWSKSIEKEKVKLPDFRDGHTAKPQDIQDAFNKSRRSLPGSVPDLQGFAKRMHNKYVKQKVPGDRVSKRDCDIEQFWKEATATGHISKEFSEVVAQFLKDYIYFG